MKLKRTISITLQENEKLIVPEGELWKGYLHEGLKLKTQRPSTSFSDYSAYGNAGSVIVPFYAIPGSSIEGSFRSSSSAAFICLVFDISKEVKSV